MSAYIYTIKSNEELLENLKSFIFVSKRLETSFLFFLSLIFFKKMGIKMIKYIFIYTHEYTKIS